MDHLYRSTAPGEGALSSRRQCLRWWWRIRIVPISLRLLSLLCAALSLALVWSECVLFLNDRTTDSDRCAPSVRARKKRGG